MVQAVHKNACDLTAFFGDAGFLFHDRGKDQRLLRCFQRQVVLTVHPELGQDGVLTGLHLRDQVGTVKAAGDLIAIGGQRSLGRDIGDLTGQEFRLFQLFDHLPAGHAFGQCHAIPDVRLRGQLGVVGGDLFGTGVKRQNLGIAAGGGVQFADLNLGGCDADSKVHLGPTGRGTRGGDLVQNGFHGRIRRDQETTGLELAGLVRVIGTGAENRDVGNRALIGQRIGHTAQVRAALDPQTDRLGQGAGVGVLALGPDHDPARQKQQDDEQGQCVRRNVSPHRDQTLPKMTDALVPPKPNELLSAMLISRGWASFGASDSLGSTAGFSRLMVGGAT